MTKQANLARLGFDTARLPFLARTGFTVALAVIVAWLMGLEHPQWAGMTVWAASLPTRGELLAKAGARLGGTILGALVGVLIVYLSQGQIAWLVVGLTVWVGFCVCTGHLFKSFLTYGSILAGYSASLVALVDTSQHDHILDLGIDRMLTALVGVVLAIGISWYFAQRNTDKVSFTELRSITAGVLRHLSQALGGEEASLEQFRHELLSRLSRLDARLETRGISSAQDHARAKRVRQLVPAIVSVLVWRRRAGDEDAVERMRDALERCATLLETNARFDELDRELEHIILTSETLASLSYLTPKLRELKANLQRVLIDSQSTETVRGSSKLILHRDWVGARQAALRAMTLMVSVGLVWVYTQAEVGGYMLLGTSVMASLFSTFDSPALLMRSVFLGQVAGATGALVCHWLVWPLADGAGGRVLLMVPFILIGVLVLGHRRTAAMGFDYNMVLLLLLQPIPALSDDFAHSLLLSAAVVVAPLIAMVGYRFVYPVNARARIETMRRLILHEVQDMAEKPLDAKTRIVWRQRIYNRMLLLVRWSDLVGDRRLPAAEWGVGVLRLSLVCEQVHALLPYLNLAEQRAMKMVLRRIARLEHDPVKVARALKVAARRLHSHPLAALELDLAARAMEENMSLFKPGTPRP